MKTFARLPSGRQLSYRVTAAVNHRAPILLHRPLGGSMRLWGDFVDGLARHHQVIAFNPLGVDDASDVPCNYTTRRMADDAVSLLDHLGVARAHVFGLSLGGMVASWMAIDAPKRLASLVLASTIPQPTAISLDGLRRVVVMFRWAALAGPAAQVALLHRILSPEFCKLHPAKVAELERTVSRIRSKRRNLINLSLAAATHHADLQQLPQALPTLLLFGAHDPLAGAKAREELQREVPFAQKIILANSGHDLSLEQPSLTADCVTRFLLHS